MSTGGIDQHLAAATAALRGSATDHNPAELRRRVELAEHQGWMCAWCEQPLLSSDIGSGQTDVDHVIPIIRGGPRRQWNRELLHSKCKPGEGQTNDRAGVGAGSRAHHHGGTA